METTEHKIATTYRTLENDPHFFGAYLNMARHNIYLIINNLTEEFDYFGFKKISDDENIISINNILSQIFNPSTKYSDTDRIKVYNYLANKHHLPFLKIFNYDILQIETIENSGIDFEKLHNFIVKSFKLLNDLRNSFSHFLAVDDEGNKITEREINVDSSIIGDIKLLFKYAPKFSFIRNQQTQKAEDYKHLDTYCLFKTGTNSFTDQGLYFFINLFLERNYATKFLKKFKGFKNETTPPFRATIQAFTAYSLKLPDVRLGNEKPLFSLLMDMLTELNKCPKELFNHLTDNDKKEFEPLLDKEKKHNVILNSTNYSNISDDDLDETLKEITAFKRYNDRFPYFALRFLDETNALPNIRFQITLGKLIVDRYNKEITGDRRVIKTINAFGKLSDFLDKKYDALNELKKNIEDNDKIQFEQYSPHYNTNNNKIAFYIFDKTEDKIAYPLVFENKENNIETQNRPSGFISIHDFPKLLLMNYFVPNEPEKLIASFITDTNSKMFDFSELEKIREKANYFPEVLTKRTIREADLIGKQGVDYLSKNAENRLLDSFKLSKSELLALDKQSFKKKTRNKKYIEHFSQIKYLYYLQQRKEELQRHLPKNIFVNMLPEKIADYLMRLEETSQEKRLHQKIKAIKDEAKQLKKSIEKEVNKSREEQNLKLGELATYIARDIINMVIDKTAKAKITTPYYNFLQNKLAYFSLNKKELISICEKLNLFDENNGHVFLNKQLITYSTGIIDFALNYLNAKINWIDTNLLERGKTGGYRLPENKIIPYGFTKIKTGIDDFKFKTWLKNKSQLPVNLPSTLLDEKLERILKRKLSDKNIFFNDGDKFSVLLTRLLNKDTQPFYNYRRKYLINKEEIHFELNGMSGGEIKRQFGKNVEKNEKLIRYIQTKDRIQKLLCTKILSIDSSVGLKEGFKLADIHPNAKHNPLESPAIFEQKIIKKGGEIYCNVVAKDTESQIKSVKNYEKLLIEKEKDEYNSQKWYQWTIKDFGRFKRFVKDRRIPNLSTYFENKNIPYDLLEYQLNEYDKYREKIFEVTFELEKYISNTDFENIKNIEFAKVGRPKGFFEIQFYVYQKWLENIKINYDEKLINKCRNRFSHSEIPKINRIPKITQQEMDEFEANKQIKEYKSNLEISIAKKIYGIYKLEVEKIIANIANLQTKN